MERNTQHRSNQPMTLLQKLKTHREDAENAKKNKISPLNFS